jgi:hypothetical protein
MASTLSLRALLPLMLGVGVACCDTLPGASGGTGEAFPRCHANADCTNPMYPLCELETGECHGCLVDADCNNHPFGRHCRGKFQCGCVEDADCATSAFGPHCQSLIPICGCTTEAECATSAAGPHCMGGDVSECGCATDAECSGSAQGPHCPEPHVFWQKLCACSSSAECGPGLSCPAPGSFPQICELP